MNTDRIASKKQSLRAVVAAIGLAFAWCGPVAAQQDGGSLRPGDRVELRSGQQGVVIGIEGAKVQILLTVPRVDVVILGGPRGDTPPVVAGPVGPQPFDPRNPGTPQPPFGPVGPVGPVGPGPGNGPGPVVAQEPPFFGSWLAEDRALVIKNATDFRIFWTDDAGTVRIDDGKYTLEGDLNTGETFVFNAGGKTFQWKLLGLEKDKMVLNYAEGGVALEGGKRTFARVSPNPMHPFAGSWQVQIASDNGMQSTASFILYPDGMYALDQFDTAGKFSFRLFGNWVADLQKATLTITFPYEKKLETLSGPLRPVGQNGFAWTFKDNEGATFTYTCQRKPTTN